jgi:hypothetical protein
VQRGSPGEDKTTTDPPLLQATIDLLASQLRGIEAQVATLRAQIERLRAAAPPRTFADLYGVLAGQSDSSAEEIDAMHYRFDWEGENSDEMMNWSRIDSRRP